MLVPVLLSADKDNSVGSSHIQSSAVELSCSRIEKPNSRHSIVFVAASILWAECDGHIKCIPMCPRRKCAGEETPGSGTA